MPGKDYYARLGGRRYMHATPASRVICLRPQSIVSSLVERIPCLIATKRTKACARSGQAQTMSSRKGRQSLKRLPMTARTPCWQRRGILRMPCSPRRGTRRIERLEQAGAPSKETNPPRTVVKERARADETVREERASADETLRLEREKESVAFSRLLPLEREKPTAICSPSGHVPMMPWPIGTTSWEW